MPYRLLADLVLVIHFLFIVFVIFGAFLVMRWLWVAWAHVPAVLWGGWIEFSSGVCPLTPLEQSLRARAGQSSYEQGFIEHYLLPLVYPGGMTRGIQLALGFAAIGLNLALYLWIWRSRRERSPKDA